MLAQLRPSILPLWISLTVLAAPPLLMHAQVNGVPASVTSYGFGGHSNPNPGVRASVTSLGPNGYGNIPSGYGNCCANFFLPSNPNRVTTPRKHRRQGDDRDRYAGPIYEPAYIPYVYPYDDASDTSDGSNASVEDNADQADSGDASDGSAGTNYVVAAHRRRPSRPPMADAIDPLETVGEEVTPQPATVLVFKDGHHSDVLNYAIVGDTLFDFSAGLTHKILLADLNLPATHKANDDRGVDFQVPATGAAQ